MWPDAGPLLEKLTGRVGTVTARGGLQLPCASELQCNVMQRAFAAWPCAVRYVAMEMHGEPG